jgi:hypothetical protein
LSICAAICQSGCFCPEGTVEHEERCISIEGCPTDTEDCPESYEYKDCGSPCTTTCDNHDEPVFCTDVCKSGCFCPEGTVEHEERCISIEGCPTNTEDCPESYEYKDCGSPCTTTCDNHDEPVFCTDVCKSGCFCPEGTAEHEERCIKIEECPGDTDTVCTGEKEWQDCGTACPLTCDNHDTLRTRREMHQDRRVSR